MIYTAIDTFYVTDEQLQNSPSRNDGIDETTETTLRIYGCDLIQESGILLKLYPSYDVVVLTLLFRFLVQCHAILSFVAWNKTLPNPQQPGATEPIL